MERLALSALSNVVDSLQEGINVVSDSAWFNAQSNAVQHTLVAGVIHNFEFVYDISIKMICRYLEMNAASPVEVDQSDFRDLLRTAAEKGLLADVDVWFEYRKMRNITAHTYDHVKANQIYQKTLTFIHDARNLLDALEARNVQAID